MLFGAEPVEVGIEVRGVGGGVVLGGGWRYAAAVEDGVGAGDEGLEELGAFGEVEGLLGVGLLVVLRDVLVDVWEPVCGQRTIVARELGFVLPAEGLLGVDLVRVKEARALRSMSSLSRKLVREPQLLRGRTLATPTIKLLCS